MELFLNSLLEWGISFPPCWTTYTLAQNARILVLQPWKCQLLTICKTKHQLGGFNKKWSDIIRKVFPSLMPAEYRSIVIHGQVNTDNSELKNQSTVPWFLAWVFKTKSSKINSINSFVWRETFRLLHTSPVSQKI